MAAAGSGKGGKGREERNNGFIQSQGRDGSLMQTDIQIAQKAVLKPIKEIATNLGIPEEYLIPYGHTKAKVDLGFLSRLSDRPDGKLILVTATTPTPAGEGKTTTNIGLTQALVKMGKKAML